MYNPEDETNENAVVWGHYILDETIVNTELEVGQASGWYAKSDIVKGIGIECPPLTASYGAQYALLQYDPWFKTSIKLFNMAQDGYGPGQELEYLAAVKADYETRKQFYLNQDREYGEGKLNKEAVENDPRFRAWVAAHLRVLESYPK
jgi:hypothetical protein